MNADILAEWYRRQGQLVVRTRSTYWRSEGLRTYQAFPEHWLIQPSDSELSELLSGHGAIAARYSAPVHAGEGLLSYHVVCENPRYGLYAIRPGTRHNVRRGLARCAVQPVSFERLTEEGWAVHLDTLERQKRRSRWSYEAWVERWRAAAELPGFAAWGATVETRLAAFQVTLQVDDCCYILQQNCDRRYLRAYVNNAISYVVSKTLLHQPSVRCVIYGIESLDAPSSVDQFKFNMGYVAKAVRQRVVFNPCLVPFVNRASYALLIRLVALRPASTRLTKAAGMIRFYLAGRHVITEQAVSP